MLSVPYDLLRIRFQIKIATQKKRILPKQNMEYDIPARAVSGSSATIFNLAVTWSGNESIPCVDKRKREQCQIPPKNNERGQNNLHFRTRKSGIPYQ